MNPGEFFLANFFEITLAALVVYFIGRLLEATGRAHVVCMFLAAVSICMFLYLLLEMVLCLLVGKTIFAAVLAVVFLYYLVRSHNLLWGSVQKFKDRNKGGE